jgi:hypothetical protein
MVKFTCYSGIQTEKSCSCRCKLIEALIGSENTSHMSLQGRRKRHELDNMIVEILEYRKSLTYTKLVEEVNQHGEEKKPSSLIVGRLVPIGYKPEVQWKKLLIIIFVL